MALFAAYCGKNRPMADKAEMPSRDSTAMMSPARMDSMLDTMPGGEMVRGSDSATMKLLKKKAARRWLPDRRQRVVQLPGALVAMGRLFRHRLENHARQALRHRCVERARIRRLLLDVLGDQRVHGLRLKRRPPRHALEQHDAGRVEVAPRVELHPRELLGRHVVGRADRGALLGETLALRAVGEPRDAEVHHLEEAARIHDDRSEEHTS